MSLYEIEKVRFLCTLLIACVVVSMLCCPLLYYMVTCSPRDIFSQSSLSNSSFRCRDPTYQEILDFLSADQTNYLVYHDPTFTCSDFAATLSKNAYKSEYRCFCVVIYFQGGDGHVLNAFNTTDRGLVYIEPQSDSVMSVIIGQKYWESNGHQVQSLDDTITKVVIYP